MKESQLKVLLGAICKTVGSADCRALCTSCRADLCSRLCRSLPQRPAPIASRREPGRCRRPSSTSRSVPRARLLRPTHLEARHGRCR